MTGQGPGSLREGMGVAGFHPARILEPNLKEDENMLRKKLQANCQGLLGGKGQREQCRVGGLIGHLPNGAELAPSRCSAQSVLCFPRDDLDS